MKFPEQILIIKILWIYLCQAISKRDFDRNCFLIDRGHKTYAGERIFDMKERLVNMAEMELDNDFMIKIRRFSDGVMTDGWFEPETEYIVEIMNRHELIDFKDYLVWLEPSSVQEESERTGRFKENSNKTFDDISQLGSWAHLPPMALLQGSGSGITGTTRGRLGCNGIVAERNIESTAEEISVRLSPRFSRILLNWRSPSARDFSANDGRNCISIVAYLQTRGNYAAIYGDMGGLRKVICPASLRPPVAVLPVEILRPTTQDPNLPPSRQVRDDTYRVDIKRNSQMVDTMQPKDCCACGTATYKVTFRGHWNSTTHPNEWPHERQDLLHWTNIIGATHMPSYSIYKIGEAATPGVVPVCMYGDTTVLRQAMELETRERKGVSNVQTGSQSGSIGIAPLLSLINAPGMWTPESMNESRTTYFAVNRTHPVFSLLTMMGPSPDWCTGVSSQSLCMADCSWIKKMVINLFPWDAGVIDGDTYLSPNSNRREVPEPIHFIDKVTRPKNPFTPNVPVAKLYIERISPSEDWQCTNKISPGVTIFESDGTTRKILMPGEKENESDKERSKTASDSINSRKLRDNNKNMGEPANTAGSGGLGANNPLSDPALANMATFLCKVSDWTAWSQCSVTCGVGVKTRSRLLVLNKKNELCQHLPLLESQDCYGLVRMCDLSAPCSFRSWTSWTNCNATCYEPDSGVRIRKRNIARLTDLEMCREHFKTDEEFKMGSNVEIEKCSKSEEECDPVAICGEGRNDGKTCGKVQKMYHYSAEDHDCLPFNYLGCKGNRNRFQTREECKSFCFKPIEDLPQWRRERMVLLQYRTSTISKEKRVEIKQQDPKCFLPMDGGNMCKNMTSPFSDMSIKWYFSKRNYRCRTFTYYGCDGNGNRFDSHDSCMEMCMPEEVHRMKTIAKAREIAKKTSSVKEENANEDFIDSKTFDVRNMVKDSQDCLMSKWTGWGPCSVRCASENGTRLRSRRILKPSRHSGKACGLLFEQESCIGIDDSC